MPQFGHLGTGFRVLVSGMPCDVELYLYSKTPQFSHRINEIPIHPIA